MIAKLNFQPPLQPSMSHDLSEIILIWFGVKETFIIFSMLETVVLLNVFVKTDHFIKDWIKILIYLKNFCNVNKKNTWIYSEVEWLPVADTPQQ